MLKVVHRQVHSWLLHECREMGGEIPLGARFADVCGCEMAGTMPRLIASAASFRWVQWVMAHPLSHGSSQAKARIAQASSAL